jgi:ankyrin repeat protein
VADFNRNRWPRSSEYADIDKLIIAGHDVDTFLEFSKRTALQIATFNNDFEMISYLLQMTKYVNWTDYNQLTAVDIASDNSIVELLRSNGGESNDEILETINQGQQSVRAVQELVYRMKLNKFP